MNIEPVQSWYTLLLYIFLILKIYSFSQFDQLKITFQSFDELRFIMHK